MADLEFIDETPTGAAIRLFESAGLKCGISDVDLCTAITSARCARCGGPRQLGWVFYETDASERYIVSAIPVCAPCHKVDEDV